LATTQTDAPLRCTTSRCTQQASLAIIGEACLFEPGDGRDVLVRLPRVTLGGCDLPHHIGRSVRTLLTSGHKSVTIERRPGF
jgi:hypothetical protein